jgi:uncharacterized membrane protein YqgA involved in biofilm formation
MPIGIIVDSVAIALGGCVGAALGKFFPKRLLKSMPLVFALVAIAIGVTLIVEFSQMAAAILALILGMVIGELLNLNEKAKLISASINSRYEKRFSSGSVEIGVFINLVVMVTCSGYGIFGALNEGISGTHTSLIVKALLDFFTFVFFAANYGALLSFICIPQFTVYIFIYLLAGLAAPFMGTAAMGDLSACAGVITMATGINLLFGKDIPVISMLPAFILILPLSRLF